MVADEPTGDCTWMAWARSLMALARNGLAYVNNDFDRDRYEKIQQIATEIMAARTGVPSASLLHQLVGELGYMTPKIDVRGAVFREDGILLVREKIDGCWSLPGGWADVNDAPSQAVEREILEESGVVARARKLVAVWDRRGHGHPPPLFHSYKLFFECQAVGGAPRPDGVEILDVGFYPLTALPPLSVGRVTTSQIQRLFQHHANPHWPTDYD